MPDGEQGIAPPEPANDEPARRFKTAADATSELHDHFGNWTSGLGKFGLQIAFALMAANWALHGSNTLLSQNPWAKWSMVVAVAYLTLLLLLMGCMVLQSWRRRQYADGDKSRWAEEFKANALQPSPWPYSGAIERTGNAMAWLHVLGPFLSGALLLMSIFVGAPGTPGSGGAAAGINGQNCYATLASDVAAIRRSVEVFTTSEPSANTMLVEGESALRLPGWPIALVGVLVFIVGLGVLFTFRETKGGQAVAASVMTAGVTCALGGFALIKEIKVGSIFTIKTERLFDYVRKETALLGATGPEQLGFVDRFKLGDENVVEPSRGIRTAVADSPKIAAMTSTWLKGRKDGMNAVLLVIGATDRLPISGAKLHQFEANVSLARARAEAVKRALIAKCQAAPECDMKEEQVIILVSGPLHTPIDEQSPPAARRDGFPEDRRVDVWAIWTRKPAATPLR